MRRFSIDSDAAFAAAANWCERLGSVEGSGPELGERIAAVRAIVEEVRTRGDAAVADYTERFDGVRLAPEDFELTPEEIDAGVAQTDPELRRILEKAFENIARFHAQHLRESWVETFADGSRLGQRVTPLERAGVYVPGGTAFYPSSVLMNIAPARVAGVSEIVMASPPSWRGSIHPAVLAAARIAGATRVFRVGGAQAVAALAYGTEHFPKVMKITGPGNIYVALAKAQVRDAVEIDSEAGPSEVVVLAEEDANPAHVAAELLAQAEHDEEAMAVLITPSAGLAEAVTARVAEEAARLPRRDIIEKSLAKHGAIIVTRGLDEAVALTNLIAPEHLSIQTSDPRAVSERIVNAGAIMIGGMTPVAAGDYFAGPNHILPTGRRARYQSPLTAEDFRKVTSILEYSPERLRAEAADIQAFAEAESLTAHARSIEVRL